MGLSQQRLGHRSWGLLHLRLLQRRDVILDVVPSLRAPLQKLEPPVEDEHLPKKNIIIIVIIYNYIYNNSTIIYDYIYEHLPKH